MLTKRSLVTVSVALLGGLLAASFTAGMFASNLRAGQDMTTAALVDVAGEVKLLRGSLDGIDRRVLQVEASRFTATNGHALQQDIIRLQALVGVLQAEQGALETRCQSHQLSFEAYRMEVAKMLADALRAKDGGG